MRSAVVLLSGGIDSTTVLSMKNNLFETIYTLSFYYKQRHKTELQAAHEISAYFGRIHRELNAPVFAGDSVLTTDAEMPHMTYEEIEKSVGVSPTYVPYRNGTFLSIAASFALDVGAEMIYTGVHAEDARGWAYPDCTPEFIGAMQNAIYVGTYGRVRLEAPLQYLEKHEIVSLGLQYGAPLRLTLSCYEGTIPACGKCPTCISRLAAFKKAGAVDPIEYRREYA